MLQTDFYCRDVEIIWCAIFKGCRRISQVILLTLHRGHSDRTASEPGTPQFTQRCTARDERANTRGVTEHFVEGNGNKISLPPREVKPVGRSESRRIQQYIPAHGVGFVNPLQWMLNRRKIGLSGESEKIVARTARIRQVFLQFFLGHAQTRRQHRQVTHLSTFGECVFTDTVDGIVIVEGQQITAVLPKGISLSHQL